ncbi:tRNA (adenosine(37)-N6)-dimethylallyltransferase MiaA [Mesorhizobium sp. J428]|uniref:tRNA (adenosine(37)-N6)-dimethylallyltransferase MiaA n=1 Tax=Mesorhizobium sp. J428 TaxID=2898440 RepID=UPI002150BA75|nr:tRNA (adenosine(37)-N6)-dimethylallyltransferase MiaA [Mesorhizobium sp. J428]MCR5859448.1 tRNA (adenosine(37)-N6)-dimethylallyltransferase MiaA [Mesorhizobium sp. J428]
MEDSGAAGGGLPLRGAVLIAGPTASGKSALALEVARRIGGAIVNADSMQVYDVLRVLTARPDAADLSAAPHHLYGHVDPATLYSTGEWTRDVERLAARGGLGGRRPIFVGGTGLYFRALLGGLSEMPQIPPAIREGWRERLVREGAARLHEILAERDAEAAAGLRPTDGQRIARALEVLDASGRSIRHWQSRTAAPLVDPGSATRIVLDIDRALLHRRIDARVKRMVEEGAVEEVRRLRALKLDPALPAMKAIGVPEFAEVLDGARGLADAISRVQAATRQYAKRQLTWFRNQLGPEWRRLAAVEGDHFLADLEAG